jgi:hypothetical protein
MELAVGRVDLKERCPEPPIEANIGNQNTFVANNF